MLAHVPSFGRNSRGSPDFLAYPVPKACMHVLGTGVPRRLGVARSASSPKAAQALGCRFTPGLRISFSRVTCMARAASVSGLWTLGFLLLRGACVWVWLSGLCLGSGVRCAPPLLAGVLGGCVGVRVMVSPFLSWLEFAVFAVGLGFRLVSHHSWLGFWGVRGCVRTPPVPHRSRLWCAVWVCVLGLRFRLRPSTPGRGVGVCACLCARPARSPAPAGRGCGEGVCAGALVAAALRHAWLGCWGVCVFVCAPRLYPVLPGWGVRCGRVCWAWVSAVPRHSGLGCWGVCAFVRVPCLRPAIPGGPLCVCVGLGFVCTPVFSWLECWGVWSLVCAAFVSRHLLGRRPWRGAVRVLLLVGFVPFIPFGFVFFAGGVSWRVVSWLCGVRRWLSRCWFSCSPSPLPLSFGLPLWVYLFCFRPRPSEVCVGVFGVS